MDKIIQNWKENAKKNEKDNFLFIRSLKMKDREPVDRLAQKLHEEAFKKINCVDCGNCCKTLKPTLDDNDIERISEYLDRPVEEIKSNYLTKNQYENWTFNSLPCPFLGEDNKCQIYSSRPKDCQSFPNTNKEGFSSRSYQHSENTLICPATYYIVEKMKQMIG